MASIFNTTHETLISGTNKADSVKNYGHHVTISTGKGNDYVDNSRNDYYVDSVYGVDFVSINTGAGKDSVYNHFSSDVTINTGSGNDYVENDSSFRTSIVTGSGNDYISSSHSASVTIDTGAGNDSIDNGIPNCTINAGAGDDFISLDYYHSYENVIVYNAGDGNDIIYGFKGDDTLSISGDSYSTTKSDSDIIVTVGEGKISLIGAASLSKINIYSIKTVTNSTKSPVTVGSLIKDIDASTRTTAVKITGNSLANSITGGSKNDSLYGGKGNDTLTGGKGYDVFVCGSGKDVITDYATGDKISLAAAVTKTSVSGSDVIFTMGKNSVTVKDAKDKTLYLIDSSSKSFSTILSDATTLILDDSTKSPVTVGSDIKTINATLRTKAVKITGNKLANTISGSSKNDSLYGGKGNDSLYGGKGNDTLWGDKGNDCLWGDAGKDRFVYNFGDGKDTIYGADSSDIIDLSGITLEQVSGLSTDASSFTLEFKDGGALMVNDGGAKVAVIIGNQTYHRDGGTFLTD